MGSQAPVVQLHAQGKKVSAIVFCIKKETCELVAGQLAAQGVRAEPFHASLPVAQRKAVQDRWQRHETPVVVCTVSFGMGIDNPHVRCGGTLSPQPRRRPTLC